MAIVDLPHTRQLMTAAEFLELPDEMRVELVQGELVEMNAPQGGHGLIATQVVIALYAWAKQNDCGLASGHESAIQTTISPDTVRGVDACYISFERLPSRKLRLDSLMPIPELCVEVRSPSNRWVDLLEKAVEYLKAGAEEVWLVDPTPVPEARFVEAHRLDRDPVRFTTGQQITSPSLPGFSAQVDDFFRHV
jgi:Uma2 family endonuclease